MVSLKQKELLKDVFKPNNINIAWLKIYLSYLIGLSTILIILLPWQDYKIVRLLIPLMGVCSIAYGLLKTTEIKEYELDYQIRKQARLNQLKHDLSLSLKESVTHDNQEIEENIIQDFDCHQFLNEVTGIAILGNSGSAKTCLVNYFAGELSPNQFIVLDPHADIENPEYPWHNYNFVVSHKPKILEVLENLLTLLDNKDRQNLVIIADEYPAIRMYAKSQKSSVADEFILRYGSEARKFNKLPIFISQSGNIKALGLDGMGDFLENFGLIRLQKIANKFLKYSPNIAIRETCKTIAYPMLINEDDLYLHPTHGHYQKVIKHQKPANIKPVHCLPLEINLNSYTRVKSTDSYQTKVNTVTIDMKESKDSSNTFTASLNISNKYPIKEVTNALNNGISDSKIIKDILGYKGRNYSKGKELLTQIKLQIEEN